MPGADSDFALERARPMAPAIRQEREMAAGGNDDALLAPDAGEGDDRRGMRACDRNRLISATLKNLGEFVPQPKQAACERELDAAARPVAPRPPAA